MLALEHDQGDRMGISHRIYQHLRGNAVAYVAVFLALSAGAYAVTVAPRNSVVSSSIKNGQVKKKDIAARAVTRKKIAKAERWHVVGPGSTTADFCSVPSKTGVFCSFELVPSTFVRWRNYGGGFAHAAFYKDQLGIVHVRGVVTTPFSTSTVTTPERIPIFRLPGGYRPENGRIFAGIGKSEDQEVGQSRVDVEANGLVTWETDCRGSASDPDCSANGGYVALDGISFRPDE